MAWIDWNASARLSLAKNEDRFIVRQYYAEVAPRVVVVVDRRPSMHLYPSDSPWLSKPAVLREAIVAIVAAAHAARAYVGYLDLAGGAHWIPPQRQSARRMFERLETDFNAPENTLEIAIDYMLELPRDVPAGAFVFILSDFLKIPPAHMWSRARARRWDVVPVIVQDPVLEQSFPLVPSLLLPIADPESGQTHGVRLTDREVRERRAGNIARLHELTAQFQRLQFDPVMLDMRDAAGVDEAFIAWAVRRRLMRGRDA
jgi:uncharacterized protein (DUF58 family)